MSNSKTTAALFLSLLLALSTSVSVAHNLYYHDANIHQNDVSNQFVDYGHVDHESHDGMMGMMGMTRVAVYLQLSNTLNPY